MQNDKMDKILKYLRTNNTQSQNAHLAGFGKSKADSHQVYRRNFYRMWAAFHAYAAFQFYRAARLLGRVDPRCLGADKDIYDYLRGKLDQARRAHLQRVRVLARVWEDDDEEYDPNLCDKRAGHHPVPVKRVRRKNAGVH